MTVSNIKTLSLSLCATMALLTLKYVEKKLSGFKAFGAEEIFLL